MPEIALVTDTAYCPNELECCLCGAIHVGAQRNIEDKSARVWVSSQSD